MCHGHERLPGYGPAVLLRTIRVTCLAGLLGIATGCSAVTTTDDETSLSSTPAATTAATDAPAQTAATTVVSETTSTTIASTTTTAPALTTPAWLGSRPLETNQNGFADPQQTPPELVDRKLPTTDTLPPPPDDDFYFEIAPFDGEPLERSTWTPECPVAPEDLRYVTVSFWGFDDLAHTGELVIAADQADNVVSIFEKLHEARFPMEEMRVITPADLDGPATGDSNNTGTYACRTTTGGSRFSEHAYGLAVDINPFHNPYERDGLVLPELATSYLDRSQMLEGMITADGVVVQAFSEAGWSWGGNWQSLKDYHHFSLNNR